MSSSRLAAIADAVLYEGYILYPYRPTSIKNRQRWTFGGVFPVAFAGRQGDAASMQTQVLVRGRAPLVDVRIRFLQVIERSIGALDEPIAATSGLAEPEMTEISRLDVDGVEYLAWDEAIEREVAIEPISLDEMTARRVPFAFDASRALEPIRAADGMIVAMLVRTGESVRGVVDISAERIEEDIVLLTVRIENATSLTDADVENRDKAQRLAFLSTHTLLEARDGAFVSLLDPPDELRDAVACCVNQGTFPVLVGEAGALDAVLSSPIILYDYPQIAPESPGDLFDGTEIDEILSLRILAMTDAEKREMASADSRARALLERTHALTAEDFARLHGARRDNGVAKPRLASAATRDGALTIGSHVRIRPKPGGDIMDIALNDKVAVVEAIERDFEDRIHIAVTLVDDPGRDLGAAGFPGHRFYFGQDEIEPIATGAGP